MKKILVFGILLRIFVFMYQSPFNNDIHIEVVYHVYEFQSIPVSSQYQQSYHPPLYYVLAAPFFPLGVKAIQFLSLVFSIGTLLVIFRLLSVIEFTRSETVKKICLLFVSFLPQLIIYGNYISNDSLSIFIGALVIFQTFLFMKEPGKLRLGLLAVYAGLGLLTKGTFLAFMPVLFLLVPIVYLRNRVDLKKIVLYLATFAVISTSLGSYKFVENIIREGRPIVHNLDYEPDWIKYQKLDGSDLPAVLDINILKLCKYPTNSEHTNKSYPLLFYGTFWYQYLIENGFTLNRTSLKFLGSFIYVVALVPTFLILSGLFIVLSGTRKLFSDGVFMFSATSTALLLFNLALVVTAGIKYQVWSCFQSRLLLPSFFSIVLLLGVGMDYFTGKYQKSAKVIYTSLGVLFVLFSVYFGTETYEIISNHGWGPFIAAEKNPF